MQGRRVYAIVETAIFMRCGIFPYTLPYTTLEVKPVEMAVFLATVEANSSLLMLVHVYCVALSDAQVLRGSFN